MDRYLISYGAFKDKGKVSIGVTTKRCGNSHTTSAGTCVRGLTSAQAHDWIAERIDLQYIVAECDIAAAVAELHKAAQ